MATVSSVCMSLVVYNLRHWKSWVSSVMAVAWSLCVGSDEKGFTDVICHSVCLVVFEVVLGTLTV